jgi:hypothetical protein
LPLVGLLEPALRRPGAIALASSKQNTAVARDNTNHNAGEGVRYGVENVIADKLEQRSVIRVATGLCHHVDLRRLVTELSRINARLDLELLYRVDRRKYDL